jgi:thymidylate kinase
MPKLLDLVIAGPDMSGTSTQINGLIDFFQKKDLLVRDIRGTEIDALFHSEAFQKQLGATWSESYLSLGQFLNTVEECAPVCTVRPANFLWYAHKLLSGGGTNQDLRVASMIRNGVSTYVNPDSADVWIMEEPTKRGAGQVNRVIEQNRSQFGGSINPTAAAETHSVYRTDEFLRFRKPLRDMEKIIIRSRSEESACYQIFDKQHLQQGVDREYYLNLAGHRVAFGNAPTNIFVACGPDTWTERDYIELKKERSNGRTSDDYESDASYQVLVNQRYATDWLEKLYEEGCQRWGGEVPKIRRFNIYDSKEAINEQMAKELETILSTRNKP